MPVHPRSRGERRQVHDWGSTRVGSSPLARGTRARGRLGRPIVGSSPLARGTLAGLPGWRIGGRRLHPRSRGERISMVRRRFWSAGSSPLARGTRLRVRPRCHRDRFIPARAGNTTTPPHRPALPPVHPRSRGERADIPPAHPDFAGSSPLARGTPAVFTAPSRSARFRFIPARAGNAQRTAGERTRCAVHPRSRGERDRLQVRRRRGTGSSPLARGTRPHRGRVRALRHGSSPLARGTPIGDLARPRPAPVHPRSRGERTWRWP